MEVRIWLIRKSSILGNDYKIMIRIGFLSLFEHAVKFAINDIILLFCLWRINMYHDIDMISTELFHTYGQQYLQLKM
jgi:hypothetical protein